MSWSNSRTIPAGTVGATFHRNPDCEPIPGSEQGPVEDFTGTAKRLEETDLYAKAVSVSEPKLSEDPCDEAPILPSFQQKILRRVEVPFTRQVKVDTTTTKLVPKVVERQVCVKKLVEVPCWEEVEEEYTEWCEEERCRDKEIWVKQIVQEKYFEKVPYKRTRIVKRPTTRMDEVEEMQTVAVETNEVVVVPSFRVDEVEDTKVVEVEEYEEIEYRPHKTGNIQLHRTRELGRIPGKHLARNTGVALREHQLTADLENIDNDSNPGDARGGRGPFVGTQGGLVGVGGNTGGKSDYRKSGMVPGGFNGGSQGAGAAPLPGDAQASFANDNFTNPAFLRPAGDFQKRLTGPGLQESRSIGLTVKNTHTRHTDGTGCLVTKVDESSPASRAGLKAGDLISSVANRPTSTVEQFREAVLQNPGPLVLSVNRDGRRNVSVTLYR